MTVVSLFACSIVLWKLATRSGSRLASFLSDLSPSVRLSRLAVVALAPLYAMQLAGVALESRFEASNLPRSWAKTLPLPVFDDRAPHAAVFARLGFGIGLAETAAIAIVVLTLRHRSYALSNRFVAVLAGILGLLSLAAPALSTTDPYEYVATGLLGIHAYAPAAGAFSATVYENIQKLIPLKGVIYGPLWVLIDTAQTSLGSSIYEKIEAIRITNLCFVALFLWLLTRVGSSRAALVGFALCPPLWYYTIANPHADIEGLVLLLAAYACARRSKTLPALVFIVAAGLIKAPFALLGGLLLVPLTSISRRLATWCAAILLVLGVSYATPSHAYVAGLSHFAARRLGTQVNVEWICIAALICAATLLLVAFRRGVFGSAWLFQQMAFMAFPWYLFWGIPYAVVTGSVEAYIVAMPFAAALLDEAATLTNVSLFMYITITLCLILDVCTSLRRPYRGVAAAATQA